MASMEFIDVWRGVSKGVEDGVGRPPYGQATTEVAIRLFQWWPTPQGIERLGMAGPGETLGSPWPPLDIRPWWHSNMKRWKTCRKLSEVSPRRRKFIAHNSNSRRQPKDDMDNGQENENKISTIANTKNKRSHNVFAICYLTIGARRGVSKGV
jgi:hypothetical protein